MKLIPAIVKGFETLWKVEFREKPLSREELARAREIEERRYGLPDWASEARERSFCS